MILLTLSNVNQRLVDVRNISLHCPVCALTLVRREAHESYGLYDASYGFISDVEMWMRLSMRGDVAYIDKPLIDVRERRLRAPAIHSASAGQCGDHGLR